MAFFYLLTHFIFHFFFTDSLYFCLFISLTLSHSISLSLCICLPLVFLFILVIFVSLNSLFFSLFLNLCFFLYFSPSFYSVFQAFSKAKSANGGSILSLSQFLILPQLPQNIKLASKVVNVDSKIIILLPKI